MYVLPEDEWAVVRSEAYAHGWQDGAAETFRKMTQLSTMLNDRRTIEALRTLLRVVDALDDEDARGSVYYHGEGA